MAKALISLIVQWHHRAGQEADTNGVHWRQIQHLCCIPTVQLCANFEQVLSCFHASETLPMQAKNILSSHPMKILCNSEIKPVVSFDNLT